jgi:NAD+ diphosphatase
MYSTLAGFLEPGESLEDCVVREVFEEAGVRVTDVQYHSSQPWPFPSSLMLGFYARTDDTELRIDPEELEDARWFERSWLKAVKDSDEFRLPRAVSIARRLVDDWLAAG